MSPDLIFTPREAGGLGLISIPVAIQAQRVKVAMRWLTGRHDIYQDAWRYWIGLEGRQEYLTPSLRRQRTSPGHWSERRRLLQDELEIRLAPSPKELALRSDYINRYLPEFASVAAARIRSSSWVKQAE